MGGRLTAHYIAECCKVVLTYSRPPAEVPLSVLDERRAVRVTMRKIWGQTMSVGTDLQEEGEESCGRAD